MNPVIVDVMKDYSTEYFVYEDANEGAIKM